MKGINHGQYDPNTNQQPPEQWGANHQMQTWTPIEAIPASEAEAAFEETKAKKPLKHRQRMGGEEPG